MRPSVPEAGVGAQRPHRKKAHRLFWRVYLHGLFLLLVVGITAAVGAFLFRKESPYDRVHRGLTQHLAEHYTPFDQHREALTRELTSLCDALQIEASLYQLDGTLLATGVTPPLPPLPATRARQLTREPRHERLPRWHMIVPILEEGKPTAYLAVRAIGEGHALYAFGLFGGILAVLALASVPLARGIVSPLEAIARTARTFGEGDLNARTGVQRTDEAGDLARAFDEMADRVQAMIRSEKELLANVSHELRTPLARIRVALELAEDGDQAEARAYLGEIGVDLAELERLIEDVLTTTRLELMGDRQAGAPLLQRQPISSLTLVKSAEARFKRRYPQRVLQVSLPSGSEAEAIILDVDPVLARRVLDNLLSNAAKYSEAPTPIRLEVSLDAATLLLEVIDRGIGISVADQRRLFEPFFRAEQSRSRAAGGVGLGLTLCKRVVEAHGGQLEVESAVGKGTTMRVRLPR